MALPPQAPSGVEEGAPRASGDGPPRPPPAPWTWRCSPRERGWPGRAGSRAGGDGVLPARAGMAPAGRRCARRATTCSPRERGWPPGRARLARVGRVLPARAGMAPRQVDRELDEAGAPRASGDGPPGDPVDELAARCSPRERGWPLGAARTAGRPRVLPARAGMAPARARVPTPTTGAPRASGDGPQIANAALALEECSPRERGWPAAARAAARHARVLPARAGMALSARALVVELGGAPRASGDGPEGTSHAPHRPRCSPRERGWPARHPLLRPRREVLPARAGMAPPGTAASHPRHRAPRASGDGPPERAFFHACRTRSPRERGWPEEVRRGGLGGLVLPARAGMAPRASHATSTSTRAPRASGDGPATREAPT